MLHDVRSQLGAIKLQALMMERLAETMAPEDAVRRLRMIERNVDRMLEMVTLVLDAARIESGTLEFERAPVSLGGVALEVAESLEPIACHAGIRIEVEPAATLDVVRGDRLRLFQVLTNLTDNALRHSPPGSTISIDVVPGVDEDWTRCRVRDQGAGVPPDQREVIFERFRQTSGETGKGAAGLGLYIARQLIELHGGRIWVEDARPGAAFVVELPRVRDTSPPG
jgi:signal transduction histidine kinase